MIFLTYSAISVCLLLILLLVSSAKHSKSKLILACWLAITGLEILAFHTIQSSDHPFEHTILLAIDPVFALLHAPLIFIYVKSIIDPKLDRSVLLHIIPAIVFLISVIPFLNLTPDARTELLIQTQNEQQSLQAILPKIILTSYVLIYLVVSYRMTIKEPVGNDGRALYWMSRTILFYLVIWSAIIALSIFTFQSDSDWSEFLGSASLVSLVMFVWYFAIIGIRETATFSSILKVESFAKSRYERSGLKKDEAELWSGKLVSYLSNHKPYLNGKLSMSELSKAIGISENHLSQIMNQELKASFFDLINQYRIEEFKRQVVEKENDYLTIFAIAQKCGFNSKSTFTSAFKRATGQTPSQYKQLNRYIPTGSNQTTTV